MEEESAAVSQSEDIGSVCKLENDQFPQTLNIRATSIIEPIFLRFDAQLLGLVHMQPQLLQLQPHTCWGITLGRKSRVCVEVLVSVLSEREKWSEIHRQWISVYTPITNTPSDFTAPRPWVTHGYTNFSASLIWGKTWLVNGDQEGSYKNICARVCIVVCSRYLWGQVLKSTLVFLVFSLNANCFCNSVNFWANQKNFKKKKSRRRKIRIPEWGWKTWFSLTNIHNISLNWTLIKILYRHQEKLINKNFKLVLFS